MHFFSSKLKKFDVHTKTIDGVHDQQTLIGAIVTVFSIAVVMLLILSEFSMYLNKDIVSHMVADTSVGVEAIQIKFDVEFTRTSCDRITFAQEVTRGTLHSHEPERIEKEPIEGRSCWVHGSLVTDKVGGLFKFIIDKNDEYGTPDVSHKVNSLKFNTMESAEYVNKMGVVDKFALDGQGTEEPEGTGLHQYSIQVVPTRYKGSGNEYVVNQYAVTERQISSLQLAQGVVLNGQMFRDTLCVVFSYDFYPVQLITEESRESVFEFFTNMCAIIGGVITLLGLLEQAMHRTTKNMYKTD